MSGDEDRDEREERREVSFPVVERPTAVDSIIEMYGYSASNRWVFLVQACSAGDMPLVQFFFVVMSLGRNFRVLDPGERILSCKTLEIADGKDVRRLIGLSTMTPDGGSAVYCLRFLEDRRVPVVKPCSLDEMKSVEKVMASERRSEARFTITF